MGDKAVMSSTQSNEMNVFLTGVLFADLSDSISEQNTQAKKQAIEKSREFKSVFVLSLQKETNRKEYEFLKEEGKKIEKRFNLSKSKKHRFSSIVQKVYIR